MKLMMLPVIVAVVATVYCEEAHTRNKRFAAAYAGGVPFFGFPYGGFPFGGGMYPGAYAGAGAYAGGFPSGPSASGSSISSRTAAGGASQTGTATQAGTASGFVPWYYPRAAYVPFPYIPFPVMPSPWYEGENVCKEVKYDNAETSKDFDDFVSDDDFTVSMDFSSEQEHCSGTNTKYVCVKRSTDNTGKITREATKYTCCYGFVRNPAGTGCVESTADAKPQTDDAGRNFYNVGGSSSSSSFSSNFS